MNLISQTAYDYWHKGKVKVAPSGWLSRNAPCCEHRGQMPDKRGRGGLKIDERTGGVSVHCFNCGFTATYTPGKPLYPKFIKLLQWLYVDENTLNQLKLESLRISKDSGYEPITHVRRDIKPIDLPECELLQDDRTHQNHIDFLKTRGFTVNDFPFLVSSSTVYRQRVILPFILHDTIVGYSARSIVPNEKMRYIMKTTTDFVFGLEWVKPEHEIVFVTEGLFDALSIKGIGVMHNEISDAQSEMISDLQKKPIVVPDLDKSGMAKSKNSLIETAIDCGWAVAFPEWDFKDINAVYSKYGSLFCIAHLLQTTIDDPFQIRLKQKIWLNNMKSKK